MKTTTPKKIPIKIDLIAWKKSEVIKICNHLTVKKAIQNISKLK